MENFDRRSVHYASMRTPHVAERLPLARRRVSSGMIQRNGRVILNSAAFGAPAWIKLITIFPMVAALAGDNLKNCDWSRRLDISLAAQIPLGIHNTGRGKHQARQAVSGAATPPPLCSDLRRL